MPRVFYGREPPSEPERNPADGRKTARDETRILGGSRSSREATPDGTGSEAETDIEAPQLKRTHRRVDTIEGNDGVAKRRKASTRGGRDASGRAPLQKACVRGSLELVKELLAAGADPEERDYAGTTALHSAALRGDISIVNALLDAGANVDARSGPDEQDTPLMDAAARSQLSLVQLLIDRGADARMANAEGRTALDFALDFGEDEEDSEAIAKILRESMAEARRQGKPPPAPPVVPAVVQGQLAPLPDVTSRSGRAEVVRRAAQGDLASVGLALEQGWQPTAEALVLAAKFGHHEVVGLMLAFGLSPDAIFEGETALHATIGRGHVVMVQLLLDSGASRDWKDKQGRTYKDLVAELPVDDPERKLIDPDSVSETIPIKPSSKTESEVAAEDVKKESPEDATATAKEGRSSGDASPDPMRKFTAIGVKSRESVEPPVTTAIEASAGPELESGHSAENLEQTSEKPAPASDEQDDHQASFESVMESQDIQLLHRAEMIRENSPIISPRHVSPAPTQQSPVINSAATRLKAPFKPKELEMPPAPTQAEIQALEDLAKRKEKERHEREAKMLENLARRQTQRDSRRDPQRDPRRDADESPLHDAEGQRESVQSPKTIDTPEALSRGASPAPTTPAIVKEVSVATLPRALRVLAYTPKPQQAALPLLVLADGNGENLQVLDIQVALALGNPHIHSEHPDLHKQALSDNLKKQLWSFVQPWLAPDANEVEAEKEKALFMALTTSLLKLDEALQLFSSPPVTTRLAPDIANDTTTGQRWEPQGAHQEAAELPFRLSMKLRAQLEQYKW